MLNSDEMRCTEKYKLNNTKNDKGYSVYIRSISKIREKVLKKNIFQYKLSSKFKSIPELSQTGKEFAMMAPNIYFLYTFLSLHIIITLSRMESNPHPSYIQITANHLI